MIQISMWNKLASIPAFIVLAFRFRDINLKAKTVKLSKKMAVCSCPDSRLRVNTQEHKKPKIIIMKEYFVKLGFMKIENLS